MKKSLINKILAAAAAVLMMVSMTACTNQNTPADSDDQGSSEVVSDTVISDADVSGSDVSASDVVVVDDETAANNTLDAYFAALNSGDVDKLVELTAAPPMKAFLSAIGLDTDYLRSGFQAAIDGMKAVAGEYHIAYEYTVVDETDMSAFAAELNALSEGAGDKVQAVRTYNVNMTAYAASAAVSDADVSASDVNGEMLEQSEGQLRLFKYDGVWYVFGD